MSRPLSVLTLGLVALWTAGSALDGGSAPAADHAADGTYGESTRPVRLIVENGSYSALQVLLREEGGKERRLGQAPPEFTNTLFIAEPLPAGAVRFLARLPGESEDLYRSEPTRLEAGGRIRWRLPDNVLER